MFILAYSNIPICRLSSSSTDTSISLPAPASPSRGGAEYCGVGYSELAKIGFVSAQYFQHRLEIRRHSQFSRTSPAPLASLLNVNRCGIAQRTTR